MILLDYRDSRPIYVQVMDGLRQQIRSGVLQPGDRLPSVRELAMELTINPNTIQRAYRELEVTGLVVSVPGKGSFVAQPETAEDREKQTLFQQFDDTAAALMAQGVSPMELIARLTKAGGANHA